jgi:hypothetical protein
MPPRFGGKMVNVMSMRDPDNPFPVFDALHIPPAALEQGGTEVLRAVVIDGELHLSLRRAFDEAETWGVLLADVARHIAGLYAREGQGNETEILHAVCAAFETELKQSSGPSSSSLTS